MSWHASMVWRVSCGIYCTISSFNGAACCSRKFEYGIQCTWFLWKLSSLALQQMLPVLVLSWQWFEGVWRSNLSYSEATLYEIRDMEILIGNILWMKFHAANASLSALRIQRNQLPVLRKNQIRKLLFFKANTTHFVYNRHWAGRGAWRRCLLI